MQHRKQSGKKLQFEREDRQLRWLRQYSDMVVQRLCKPDLDAGKALVIIEEARCRILHRFPGRERAFENLYRRRFVRVLARRGIILNLPQIEYH